MQKATREEAGRRAQKHGSAFETEIARHFVKGVTAGLVHGWYRQEPPVRRLRSGRLVRTAEGPPDYLAWGPSWAWQLEAKHTDTDRLPWAQLKQHQAEKLTDWLGPGRMSAVLIRYGDSPDTATTVLVPWPACGPLWYAWSHGQAARGDASLHVAEAVRMAHAAPDGNQGSPPFGGVGWNEILEVIGMRPG